MYMYVCYMFREDLSKLDYTTMCIKETLRLHTIVPFIGKLSSEDVVVDGYRIPKGMLHVGDELLWLKGLSNIFACKLFLSTTCLYV